MRHEQPAGLLLEDGGNLLLEDGGQVELEPDDPIQFWEVDYHVWNGPTVAEVRRYLESV